MSNKQGNWWVLRFRVSTLLGLVAIVALAVSWALDRQRLTENAQKLTEKYEDVAKEAIAANKRVELLEEKIRRLVVERLKKDLENRRSDFEPLVRPSDDNRQSGRV